jgi:hypothetical protein
VSDFDLLAVCMFNQTGLWQYRFTPVSKLERRDASSLYNYLKVMQRIPPEGGGIWADSLRDAIAGLGI